MKTVSDAVDHYDGKWPSMHGNDGSISHEGMRWIYTSVNSDFVCTRAEFEAEVERRNKESMSVTPNNVDEKYPKWSGEGLPPVGCEFEFSANGVSWEHRIMLFNDGISCLMAHGRYPANRWHYKSDDPDLKFRPLKTKEEREVGALYSDIQAWFSESNEGMYVPTGLSKFLHEQGYRKQEPTQ